MEPSLRRNLLGLATFMMIEAAIFMIFIWAPTEQVMGIVQRIFYFHVSCGMTTFLAFFIVFLASILYLWKKDKKWDIVAHASAELGVLFCTLVLLSGPIWARPIWGTWWTWDARLTTSLVLWLIYVAYLMLRSASRGSERRTRFAAVFGIVGFVDVPLVYLSIHWWRTIHPVVIKPSGIGLAPPMLYTFLVSWAAITILYFYLLGLRIRIGKLSEGVEELKAIQYSGV